MLTSVSGLLIIFHLCSCSANQVSLLLSINSNLTKNMQNKNRTEPMRLTVQPELHAQDQNNNETLLRLAKRNEEFLQSDYNYGNERKKNDEVMRPTDSDRPTEKKRDSWVGTFLLFWIIGVCVFCCILILDRCSDPIPECLSRSTLIVNIPSGSSNHSNMNNTNVTYVEPSPTELLTNEIRQARHEELFGLPFPRMVRPRPPVFEDNPPAYPGVTRPLDHSNPPPYSSAWVRIGCLQSELRQSVFTNLT